MVTSQYCTKIVGLRVCPRLRSPTSQ